MTHSTAEAPFVSIENLVYQPVGVSRPILDIKVLRMFAGNVTAIVGPNGSGKTTLLRLIAGDIQASHGVISFNPTVAIPKPERRRHSAYLLVQDPRRNIFTDLLVKENLKLITGTSSIDVIKRQTPFADCLIDRIKMLLESDRMPSRRLSGGESQLLGLFLAVACDPVVLLLDEHTASLDPTNKRMVSDIVRSLRTSKRLILWVTQDVALAREYADSFITLIEGKVESGEEPQQSLKDT